MIQEPKVVTLYGGPRHLFQCRVADHIRLLEFPAYGPAGFYGITYRVSGNIAICDLPPIREPEA